MDEVTENIKPEVIRAGVDTVNMNQATIFFGQFVAEGNYTLFIWDEMPDENTVNNRIMAIIFINGVAKLAIRCRDKIIQYCDINMQYDGVMNVGDVFKKYEINVGS